MNDKTARDDTSSCKMKWETGEDICDGKNTSEETTAIRWMELRWRAKRQINKRGRMRERRMDVEENNTGWRGGEEER